MGENKQAFLLLLIFLITCFASLRAADTLYFKVSNPWNTVKDPAGKYLRKVVKTDSGYLSRDYNESAILVVRGYYTDTNFTRKLYRHVYFNEQKGYIEQIRSYENGRLNGIRAGFNEKGDTLWRETFVENSIVDTKNFPGYTPEPTTFSIVEKEALFPGGREGWNAYLSSNLKYPPEARSKKIEGTVIVSFVVSKEGNVNSIQVVQSAHPLLDQEAVRLIQVSPKWKPAMQNGKKVNAYLKQRIDFRL